MRKFLISATLLASSLAIAAPAAAQWGQPNYGYGYQQNYGQARQYQMRITQLHNRIHNLQNRLSRGEFLRLNQEVDSLKYRLRQVSYRGIGQREARDLNWRIAQIERTIYRFARDDRGNGGHHGNQYGYNQSGYDRDRDGLDDRYERDGGRDYDEDHDDD